MDGEKDLQELQELSDSIVYLKSLPTTPPLQQLIQKKEFQRKSILKNYFKDINNL